MNFSWLMKYFKKQKHRTRSNLKIIWVKVKAREKRREKAYEEKAYGKDLRLMKEVKTLKVKTTLHLPTLL